MRTKNMERLTIGEVAQAAGVATTTLRYYEREGLLSPTDRSRAGYRLYDEGAVGRLEFIRAAQAVGFTLDDIRALLELSGDSPCKRVQALIERRLGEVDGKLADLRRVRSALADALERCRKSKKGCAVVADLKRKRQ
jgi:MerR family mercuric resistance operon transcriptional regulator